MKRWFLLTLILGLAIPGLAQIKVSPASITTGLRWDNVAGGLYSYSGTVLTVTGDPGTVTWTIKDQDGITVTTLLAAGGRTLGWPTRAATPPDHTAVFGQIDCTGSPSNTLCVYNAPGEYPPGETATLVATSGGSSSGVSVTFTFAYNLQEYFKHRARMLGFQSKPVATLMIADHPVRYQPELLVFQSGPLPGGANYEYQIIQDDNDVRGAGFPATGGSMVNRPSWSYDGKWFAWTGARCNSAWCSSSPGTQMIAQTDGSNLQPLLQLPFNTNYTFGYDKPNWLLTSDPSHISVLDLDDAQELTTVASYSSNQFRRIYSQVTRQYAEFKESNHPPCRPVSPACSVNVYIYDLASCEANLRAGCAALYSEWNINLNLPFVWDSEGRQHCTMEGGGFNCEWHNHDMWLLRNTTNTVWNYGPAGDVGEAIQFMTDANGKNAIELIPNTSTDTPYLSHPAVNWSGELAAYGGQQRCQPSNHSCTNNTWGSGIWDFRKNKAVVFIPGMEYGHGAWDGFDDNHFAHDGYGGSCPVSHWCLQSSTVDYHASTIQDSPVLDFGTRDHNQGGEHSYGLLYGPSQSPDATKLAQSMQTSFSAANQALGWIVVVGTPSPPLITGLANSTSATFSWLAPALNHEAKAYHVYRQNSCHGHWERLAGVKAVYLQQTYSYTDLGLGPGQNACYGVTTEEWTGTESKGLSDIIGVTNAAGAFSGEKVSKAGTADFDRSPPAPPSDFTASPTGLATPGAPYSVVQAPGGSLPDGNYRARLAYCNYSDFPANNAANARCTSAGPAQSGWIKGGNGTAALTVTGPASEPYGQVAVQIYACGPHPWRCPETLQATVVLPMPPNAWPGQVIYTLKDLGAGTAAATANQTVQGYSLKWTASSASDVRYYALYSRDDQAPPLAGVDAFQAQRYLIATVPAPTTSYLDYLPDWTRIYNRSGGPFYGIVAVDRMGNRSAPSCLRADTGASVPCE